MSVHGYGRRGYSNVVLIGGRNRALAIRAAAVLRVAVPSHRFVDDLSAIPPTLRGVHPQNPVNRTRGGGIQIELPPALRDGDGSAGDRDALVAARAVDADLPRPVGCVVPPGRRVGDPNQRRALQRPPDLGQDALDRPEAERVEVPTRSPRFSACAAFTVAAVMASAGDMRICVHASDSTSSAAVTYGSYLKVDELLALVAHELRQPLQKH